MKKFIKRLFGFVVCLALAVALVRVGPYVYERLFGGADTQWISEQFSQTLREKNELVVYEVEVTGQETVTQDAWLLGTVQKVEMPYTFRMSFTVDLSLAVVSALDDGVEVRVPPPVAAYPKLIVQEDQVRTYDWLYPLTPERYSAIKQETEDRLFSDYGANEGYLSSAWDVTVRNLESLFRSVAEQRGGADCAIRVVRDDSLIPAETSEVYIRPSFQRRHVIRGWLAAVSVPGVFQVFQTIYKV